MLALLIQSIYNIVDSYFVARYSAEGWQPFHFSDSAAVRPLWRRETGAGINILISRMDGVGRHQIAEGYYFDWFFLELWEHWFCSSRSTGYPDYYQISSEQNWSGTGTICPDYFRTVLGMFVSSRQHKMPQAKSDMVLPIMLRQQGAVLNIVLDPFWFSAIAAPLGAGSKERPPRPCSDNGWRWQSMIDQTILPVIWQGDSA